SLQTFIAASLLTLCDGVVETVVGIAGRTVSLPCRYDSSTLGILAVCWGMGAGPSLFGCENTVISTNGEEVVYRRTLRHRLAGQTRRGEVSLNIYSVQEEDSGFYHCRVELPGLFNDLAYTFHLIIRQAPVIPSDASVVFPNSPAQTLLVTNTPGSTFTPEKNKQSTLLITAPEYLLAITETTGSTLKPEKGRAHVEETDVCSDGTTGPVISFVKTKQIMGSPSLESFIGHTVRVGAVVFIPALIISLLLSLRRSRKSRITGQRSCYHRAGRRIPNVDIPLSALDEEAWIYGPTNI
ncbi:hypothetical protein UPYG_G00125870, partial [Umbra pygmaea]